MKNQALFSFKDKSKKLKCPLLQFLFGALRVKILSLRRLLILDSHCCLYMTALKIYFKNSKN